MNRIVIPNILDTMIIKQLAGGLLLWLLVAAILPAQAQLLSKQELESQTVFDNLETALQQPDKVYVLDLYNKGLKSLPADIGKLTKLQRLYLYENDLSSLPAEIGKCTNLQELFMNSCATWKCSASPTTS
jgi:Leucine-rich repeat (LRR) protein